MLSGHFKPHVLAALIASVGAIDWSDPNLYRGLYFIQDTGAALVTERLDPIISPGTVSNHVHNVIGSNAFAANLTYEKLQEETTCSTMFVKPDKSSYWMPSLYFQHPTNKSFHIVPERPEHKLYYLNRSPDPQAIEEFPPGFRMIAGSAMSRSMPKTTQGQGVIEWMCHGPDIKTPGFPTGFTDCSYGLAGALRFPYCWNGNDYDPANPSAHMSYPEGDNPGAGSCPASHPRYLPHIFLEFWLDTTMFNGMYTAQDTPWVLASGDPTGYGWHADFFNGWDEGVLLNAMKTCMIGESGDPLTDCFEVWDDKTRNACKQAPVVNEVIDGWLDHLPGCNPIQAGPEDAVVRTDCPWTWVQTLGGNAAAAPSNAAPVASSSAAAPSGTKAASSAAAAPTASSTGSSMANNPMPSLTVSKTGSTAMASPTATSQSASASMGSTTTSKAASAPVATGAADDTSAGSSDATLPSGWVSNGCYVDNINPRSLTGITFANVGEKITSSNCAAYCAQKGYKIAGTEYGNQCFCGNSLDKSTSVAQTVCNMPCDGNANETCGGKAALSVFSVSGTALTTKTSRCRLDRRYIQRSA